MQIDLLRLACGSAGHARRRDRTARATAAAAAGLSAGGGRDVLRPRAGDASLLGGGISKALVNTAAGLSVALPSLALHHFFHHRLTTCGLALEEELDRVLDARVRPGAA